MMLFYTIFLAGLLLTVYASNKHDKSVKSATGPSTRALASFLNNGYVEMRPSELSKDSPSYVSTPLRKGQKHDEIPDTTNESIHSRKANTILNMKKYATKKETTFKKQRQTKTKTSSILSSKPLASLPSASSKELQDASNNKKQKNFGELLDMHNIPKKLATKFNAVKMLVNKAKLSQPVVNTVNSKVNHIESFATKNKNKNPTIIAPTTSPSTEVAYLQFYQSPTCSGESNIIGYKAGQCTSKSSDGTEYSTYYCHGDKYHIKTYSSSSCSSETLTASYNFTIGCYNLTEGGTVYYGCASDVDTIPTLPTSTYVTSYNYNASLYATCPSNTENYTSFMSYNTETCFPNNGLDYYKFGCTAGGKPSIYYYSDAACTYLTTASSLYDICIAPSGYYGQISEYTCVATKANDDYAVDDDAHPDDDKFPVTGAYAYVVSYTSGYECSGDNYMASVTGYSVGTCIEYNNGTNFVSKQYSCGTNFKEIIYDSTNCDPATVMETHTIFLDVCYPYNAYQSYVAYCAANIDDINVHGNFVVDAQYSVADTTCSASGPDYFYAFNTDYCFIDEYSANISYTFGCSQSHHEASVKGYSDLVCHNHVETTYLNPYCNPVDISSDADDTSPMLIGHAQAFCKSTVINGTVIYDDDYYSYDDGYYYDDDNNDDNVGLGYSYLSIYGSPGCSADIIDVEGFLNTECIEYNNGDGLVSIQLSCAGDIVEIIEYSSSNCNPNTITNTYEVPSNICFDDDDAGSVIYGCAATVYDIPVTGIFVVDAFYSESDCAPLDQPDAFILFSTDFCFVNDDNTSYIFGCSRSHSTSSVQLYNDDYCGNHYATVFLNPYCNANEIATNITVGYEQYFCDAINTTSFYDDEFATDDTVRPAGYFYLQYYTDVTCDGETTFSQGVALEKCLVLYDDNGLIVGSSMNYCSEDDDTFTQYNYKSFDCSGSYTINTTPVNTCYVEGGGDDDLSSFDSLYGHSYKPMCSSGETIPISQTSIVLKGYESNSAYCDTSVVIFEAISTGVCFVDPYATPIHNSYLYSCDADSMSETYYNTSATCAGSNNVVVPLPTECKNYNFGDAMKALAQHPDAASKSSSLLFYKPKHRKQHDKQPHKQPKKNHQRSLSDKVGDYYYGSGDDYFGYDYYYYGNDYYYAQNSNPFDYYQLSCGFSSYTKQPTSSPTVHGETNPPTIKPTGQPVSFPTHNPTPTTATSSPTYSPASVVAFSQTINGCGYDSYSLDTVAYEFTLMSAITSSIPGLEIYQITVFEVIPPTPDTSDTSTPMMRSRRLSQSTATTLALSYVITSPTLTASTITHELTNSVDGGLFTNFMDVYASQYGATGLVNAYSTSVSTAHPADNDDSGLSDGIIAVITIFVIIGVVGFVGGVYYYLTRIAKQQQPNIRDSVQLAPVVSDVSKKDHVKGNDVENPMTAGGAAFGTVVTPSAPVKPMPSSTTSSTAPPVASAPPALVAKSSSTTVIEEVHSPMVSAAVAVAHPVESADAGRIAKPEPSSSSSSGQKETVTEVEVSVAPADVDVTVDHHHHHHEVESSTAHVEHDHDGDRASPTTAANRSSSPMPPAASVNSTSEDVAAYAKDDKVTMESNPMRKKKGKK